MPCIILLPLQILLKPANKFKMKFFYIALLNLLFTGPLHKQVKKFTLEQLTLYIPAR